MSTWREENENAAALMASLETDYDFRKRVSEAAQRVGLMDAYDLHYISVSSGYDLDGLGKKYGAKRQGAVLTNNAE